MMAIILAVIFGKTLISTYETEQVMTSSGNVYLLQYGSYINKDVMNENIARLDDYLIYEIDGKYYVHLGAYTNIDTAVKMQKYFENNNIYTYIKNDYIGNMEIIDKITELDLKILQEDNFSQNINYNKKILEILKNDVS